MKKSTIPMKIYIILITSIFLLFFIWVNSYITNFSKNLTFSNNQTSHTFFKKNLTKYQVWMILWARVYKNWRLSDILKDRTDTAIEFYNKWYFDKFLVSWDHGQKEYDEVNAVKNYLLNKWIKGNDIFLDHAWFDTFDSFYRAKNIFEIESLFIFTQEFHLPRSVYLAKKLWINNVYWIVSDKHIYLSQKTNNLREYLAKIKAFLEIQFWSKSKYLWDKILISWDWKVTWD